eukprot:364950-Chlamydomonas_euryale.AAC.22
MRLACGVRPSTYGSASTKCSSLRHAEKPEDPPAPSIASTFGAVFAAIAKAADISVQYSSEVVSGSKSSFPAACRPQGRHQRRSKCQGLGLASATASCLQQCAHGQREMLNARPFKRWICFRCAKSLLISAVAMHRRKLLTQMCPRRMATGSEEARPQGP